MTRRPLLVALTVLVAGVAVWLLVWRLPAWFSSETEGTPAPEAPAATRRIKARLFYVADDGMRLVPVEREVPFGEGTFEQARRILEAQLAPPPAPLTSAVPTGTTLRGLYVTDRGTAYVDLSREVRAAHLGGSVSELLTVYTIVDALTANLPAISAVQILVDGRQVDSLAGHVDLRRPLARNSEWVDEMPPAPAAPAPTTSRAPGGN